MQSCLINTAPYGHYPHGFNNWQSFSNFVLMLINRPEMPGDATFIVQGSSVTGVSYEGRKSFDVGRVSDFDIGIASSTLWERSLEKGVEVRHGQDRTGPLDHGSLEALGIARVSAEAHLLVAVCSNKRERPVHFMVFENEKEATQTGPSLICGMGGEEKPRRKLAYTAVCGV